jgi:hypothetical protein
MDYTDTSSLSFLSSYPLSPFRINKDQTLYIPEKYLDVLLSLQSEESKVDFRSLKATDQNWKMVRELLVSGYWMDCWNRESDKLPTPKSEFIAINDSKLQYTWDTGKFIRLNSLSPKNQNAPLYVLDNKTLNNILATPRCQESMAIAKRTDREISIVVRDWVDLTCGVEWRCFVFEDTIKAICINDESDPEIDNDTIILRAEALFRKVRYSLPCVDCVMDIWLHDTLPEKDLLIEFNSYGFYGNSDAGLFDWIEDGTVLYNPEKAPIEVRRQTYH